MATFEIDKFLQMMQNRRDRKQAEQLTADGFQLDDVQAAPLNPLITQALATQLGLAEQNRADERLALDQSRLQSSDRQFDLRHALDQARLGLSESELAERMRNTADDAAYRERVFKQSKATDRQRALTQGAMTVTAPANRQGIEQALMQALGVQPMQPMQAPVQGDQFSPQEAAEASAQSSADWRNIRNLGEDALSGVGDFFRRLLSGNATSGPGALPPQAAEMIRRAQTQPQQPQANVQPSQFTPVPASPALDDEQLKRTLSQYPPEFLMELADFIRSGFLQNNPQANARRLQQERQ